VKKNKFVKKFLNWRFFLGMLLIASSVVMYYTHYVLFHDKHHIFIYLVGDIAFVPVEVLLVTLIIHHLLEKKEKRSLVKKLNMLIGAFFSEVGIHVLASFEDFDEGIDKFRKRFILGKDWTDEHFELMRKFLKRYKYIVNSRRGDLNELKVFLTGKREFLLSLLANPNLLEHESFTELLWAVFHLSEELSNRQNFEDLPETDLDHLSGDIRRAYEALTWQWLEYMVHLKRYYPYLFSLALRKNPFDLNTSVIVK